MNTNKTHDGPCVNLDEARRFLKALDPVSDVFTFTTFDDNTDRKLGSLNYTVSGTLDECAEDLIRLSGIGAGVFVCVASTDLRGRKATNIQKARAFYIDRDKGGSDLSEIVAWRAPHIVVESSPGKWHIYWRTDDIAKSGFTQVQKVLSAKFGTDEAVSDITRVMRLPGFIHQKNENTKFMTRVDEINDIPSYKYRDIKGDLQITGRNRSSTRRFVRVQTFAEVVRSIATAQPSNRNNALYQGSINASHFVNRGEIEKDEAINALMDAARQCGLTDNEAHPAVLRGLSADVENPLGFPEVDRMGTPTKSSFFNTMFLLEYWYRNNAHLFRYNEFTSLDMVDNEVYSDSHINRFMDVAMKKHNMFSSPDIWHQAIKTMCLRHPYHPVCDYLRALKWDKKPRVDRMLVDGFGATDTPLNRAASTLLMVAAVKRVMEPGCKFDVVAILEGKQGSGKSTGLSILGGDWYTDASLFHLDEKAQIESLQGAWIYEIAELTGFRKAEVQRVKAFISRTYDSARMAYARTKSEFPRQCVFVGSTNDSTYLTDSTGNRRFLPVQTGRVDFEYLEENRDQLWAEANFIASTWYKNLELPPELFAAAANEADVRMVEDAMQDMVADIVPFVVKPHAALPDGVVADAEGRVFATSVSHIFDELGYDAQRRNPYETSRITNMLSRMGWCRRPSNEPMTMPNGKRIAKLWLKTIKEGELNDVQSRTKNTPSF